MVMYCTKTWCVCVCVRACVLYVSAYTCLYIWCLFSVIKLIITLRAR
jgi:hypothetical protein